MLYLAPRQCSNCEGKTAQFSPYRHKSLMALGLGGGRYRIRTYDFHRVKMALYR